ncbi:MAG TPA: methionine gamma-lyase family protein [Candidatus Obscuribacterales bacterium]
MPALDLKPHELIRLAEKSLAAQFEQVDEIALFNQRKILNAFREHRLTEEHFAERTGYGLDDSGRDAIDSIFAAVFGCEAAAVRMQMVSGTHALACALFGVLKANDTLLALTGTPYDTLRTVIGLAGDEPGNLRSLGIMYLQRDTHLKLGSEKEIEEIEADLQDVLRSRSSRHVVFIQKSRGYSLERKSLSNKEIKTLIACVKRISPQSVVIVDNCYGEFVEAAEPIEAGADLIAGSLIKNPGGGLVIAGGYLAGRAHLVDMCLNRLTAPGIGGHQGISFNQNRLILQGLFMAPQAVGNAVKGALLAAHVFEELGLKVTPSAAEQRFDIIQGIEFGSRERLINFCRAVQKWSPVNAHAAPEPARMPGYQDEVIMAGGTFVEGATIELSADGPLRPPYAAYLQGGLTYLHVKCMLEGALSLSASGELPFF